MILDTCFIIDLLHKDKSAIEKLKELNSTQESQIITTVSVFELFTGIVQYARPEQERANVMDIINSQIIIPLDMESAMKGGEIDGQLTKKGQTVDQQDSMIAGIALTRNEKILTRNVKDFSKIHGLRVETY